MSPVEEITKEVLLFLQPSKVSSPFLDRERLAQTVLEGIWVGSLWYEN
jgi:hypothetical protein